jgi:hypothetical protein
MDGARVRQWMAGFEAIAAADREEWRRRGPEPAWSIRLALSMIEAARRANRAAVDPRRAAEEDAVRAVWERVRDRLRR